MVFLYLITEDIKNDIPEIPRPLPETRNISTISLLFLKYWPTISVEVSLVMVIPTPAETSVKLNQVTLKRCLTFTNNSAVAEEELMELS